MEDDSTTVSIYDNFPVSINKQRQWVEDYRIQLQDTSKLSIHQCSRYGRIETMPLLLIDDGLRMTVRRKVP